MKVWMDALFQVLKKNSDRTFVPVGKTEFEGMRIGGFTFVIDGKTVHFDWDAFCCNEEENTTFHYESGYGYWFNSHEISEMCEEDLQNVGLSREALTASFLASASEITEFCVFIDTATVDDIMLGEARTISTTINDYRLILKDIWLTDDSTDKDFHINQSVLDKFNSEMMSEEAA